MPIDEDDGGPMVLMVGCFIFLCFATGALIGLWVWLT